MDFTEPCRECIGRPIPKTVFSSPDITRGFLIERLLHADDDNTGLISLQWAVRCSSRGGGCLRHLGVSEKQLCKMSCTEGGLNIFSIYCGPGNNLSDKVILPDWYIASLLILHQAPPATPVKLNDST